MEKLRKLHLQTEDLTNENVEKLGALFPELLTEVEKDGKLIKTIDVEKLKEVVGDYADKDSEVYELTWAGKQNARRIATEPTNNTLRPVISDSEDFENTENLYIEGDNLEVLKILRKSYSSKIKCIYIDPPYNTRKDFVYKDNFTRSKQDEDIDSGAVDEDGNRMKINNGTDGKYHSNWLNMIYPRLQLAHKLLKKDGVIFISIGEDEIANLTNLCNEIFGESNRVGIISRMMKSGGNKGQYFSPNIDYILVYAKNIFDLKYFREPISEETANKSYTNIETEGIRKGEKYSIKGLCQPGLDIRPNQRYWLQCPDGTFIIPKGVSFPSKISEGEKIIPKDDDNVWKWIYERYEKEKANNNIIFKPSSTATALVDEKGNVAKWNVFNKIWLNDRLEVGRVPVNFISKWENRLSSSELKKLNIPFDFAKPSELIKYFLILVDKSEDAIVLDFFSGSATTAHAVMQLNAEDNGNRKFIMVQLDEKTDEDSEAYKAGYKNICEIGKERIRRAAKKIKEDNKDKDLSNVDFGFKVFKLGNSIYKDTLLHPGKITQENLEDFAESIKTGTSEEDVLYSVLLGMGIPLSAKVEIKTIQNKKVFVVADGLLITCFDKNIDLNLIKELAKIETTVKGLKPKFVFKESSIKNDSEMMGIMDYLRSQIFKTTAEMKDYVRVI